MVTYLFETHITYVDQALRKDYYTVRAAFNGYDPKFIQTHVVDGRVIFQIEECDQWFAMGGKVKHSPWVRSIDHLMDMVNLYDLSLHPVVLTEQYGEWEDFEWINDNGTFIWCKPWSMKAVYIPVGPTIIRG